VSKSRVQETIRRQRDAGFALRSFLVMSGAIEQFSLAFLVRAVISIYSMVS
jgi:hypothetical protein